mmetsp:Transcript_5806/g.9539  ORF Transcript_5806/g.9539 Transcript_5806/m.9539 type:complete len:180 (+) Transcript_5806:83-622(+)
MSNPPRAPPPPRGAPRPQGRGPPPPPPPPGGAGPPRGDMLAGLKAKADNMSQQSGGNQNKSGSIGSRRNSNGTSKGFNTKMLQQAKQKSAALNSSVNSSEGEDSDDNWSEDDTALSRPVSLNMRDSSISSAASNNRNSLKKAVSFMLQSVGHLIFPLHMSSLFVAFRYTLHVRTYSMVL